MSNELPLDEMSESEAVRFSQKLQSWAMTLETNEQRLLGAIFWCVRQAGALDAAEDVAGYSDMSQMRTNSGLMNDIKSRFDNALKIPEGTDRLGSFEIQILMRTFSQAQTYYSAGTPAHRGWP